MDDPVTAQSPTLISKVESYLAGEIGHDAIREFAWGLADDAPTQPEAHEEPFWSCVFTIIHLADAEHWRDGCTQRDLGSFLRLLREGKPIPDEWKRK